MASGNYWRRGIFAVWRLPLLIGLASIAGLAQGQKPTTIEDQIARLKQGRFSPLILNQLAKAQAHQAIPPMKQQFTVVSDVHLKEALASALVRLGDKEQVYWDFLLEHATAALETGAPFAILFDSQGAIIQGKFSPEFLAWAKSHNVSPNEASYSQVYGLPLDISYLAITGDPRGRSLLRRALSENDNYFVQVWAAKGLAKLQDNASIPLIIRSCEKAPSGLSVIIAHSLVFFDDPRAQSAAERFIPDRRLLEELRKQSHEKGPDAIFDIL